MHKLSVNLLCVAMLCTGQLVDSEPCVTKSSAIHSFSHVLVSVEKGSGKSLFLTVAMEYH